jgi:hypothetical protein
VRALSDDPFYITVTYAARCWLHLSRGDLAAAGDVLREGLADGARPEDMKAIEAMIAAREGRVEDAGRLLRELEAVPALVAGTIMVSASAALRIGEVDAALRMFDRKLLKDLAQTIARLDPELHPLLDREPFAPRRRDVALVWPLEAPMMDAAIHRLFREVRIESGLSQGSDVR